MGHIPSARQPWYVERPRHATDFVLTAGATGVAVGPGPVTNVSVTGPFTLPDSCEGVIKTVNFYVDNLLLSSQITFALWASNSPVVGLGKYPVFPSQLPFFSVGFSRQTILLNLKDQVQVVVSVADGGSYTVGADVVGWYAPKELNERYEAGEVF